MEAVESAHGNPSLFQAAIDREETPAALEGLSWAVWWLNDADTMLATRERAFRRYREAGDLRGAARAALWLASDHLDFRGETALANGWRERARRLLDALGETPEHAWLAVLDPLSEESSMTPCRSCLSPVT